MTIIKHVTIPQPCTQRWEDMNPETNGRHCDHCSKTVIDFTAMPSDEILKFIAGQSHTCGRFNQFQMENLNRQIERDRKMVSFWRKGLAAASLVGLLSFIKAEAKSRYHGTEQAPAQVRDTSDRIIGKIAYNPPSQVTIKGTIIDNNDKLPIAGAMIRIKGTNVGATADANGHFTLKIIGSAQVLVVNMIGYSTQEEVVPNVAEDNLCIAMRPVSYMLGEVVIVRRPFLTRMYYRFIRRPFRKLFH